MKGYAMLRSILMATATGLSLVLLGPPGAFGQDVGADVSGGAGIFRPKNPETRKKAAKPATPVTKPSTPTRARPRGTRVTTPANDDRVEDLLEKGNE